MVVVRMRVVEVVVGVEVVVSSGGFGKDDVERADLLLVILPGRGFRGFGSCWDWRRGRGGGLGDEGGVDNGDDEAGCCWLWLSLRDP